MSDNRKEIERLQRELAEQERIATENAYRDSVKWINEVIKRREQATEQEKGHE